MYQPLQNRDAFAFFDGAFGKDKARYEVDGVLGAGERVWLRARLPGEFEVIKGDAANKGKAMAQGNGVSPIFSTFEAHCPSGSIHAASPLPRRISTECAGLESSEPTQRQRQQAWGCCRTISSGWVLSPHPNWEAHGWSPGFLSHAVGELLRVPSPSAPTWFTPGPQRPSASAPLLETTSSPRSPERGPKRPC